MAAVAWEDDSRVLYTLNAPFWRLLSPYNLRFDSALEKLQRTLKQINLNKSTLIKAALEAYEQREEARKKCAAYIEKNERESSLFESEIRDLSRNIDHEKQLFKFMQEKGKERSTELPESAKIKKERKARNEKHLQIQKLASEEEALHRIQQALGETKLENIVEKFRKTQEENYALFKYVNEQNAQIEEIKELIGKYKQEKKEQKISHKTILESFHQKMRTYEKEYISSKKARENAEQSLQVVRAELKVILTEVEGLFRAAQCPLEAVTDPLLPSEIKISQENLLIYLTAVENRVDDLLKLRSLRGKNKTSDPESSQVSENETSPNQKTYTFSVPSARTDAGAISDDSGADLRLLTHEEIKQIIIKS
nr:unnamed protein product [Spirometra erinaceieuropaei]